MMKRKSVKMTVILTSLLAMLAGFLPMLGLRNVSPARAETGFDYSADMTKKVEALPKNDTSSMYVINSIDNSVEKIRLNYAGQMMNLSFNMTRKPIRIPYVTVFTDYGEELRYLGGLKPSNLNSLDTILSASRLWSEGMESDLLIASSFPSLSGTIIRQSKDRRTFATLGGVMVDAAKTDYDFLSAFSNIQTGYWQDFTSAPESIRNSRLPLFKTFSGSKETYPGGDLSSVMEYTYSSETQYIYLAYAVKAYTVTFEYLDVSGAWTTVAQSYAMGTTIEANDAPSLPTVPYGKFLGWNRPFGVVKSDLSFKANYQFTKFSLTFQNRDGTIYRVLSLTYYDKFPEHKLTGYTVKETGKENTYTFDGWSTIPGDVSAKINESSMKVSADLVLYPLFRLSKSVDLSTGNVTDYDKPGSSGLIGSIGELNQKIKDIPVIGGILYVLAIIIEIGIGIVLLVLIIKFVIWIVEKIKGLELGRRFKSFTNRQSKK